MSIKTVIFDIGGVLVGYDWDKQLMKQFNDREKVERLKDALFHSGVWDELDRGIWSEEELLAGFYEKGPGLEREIKEFWDHAGEALWQYDFTKDLLNELKKKNMQILYLSNWSKHMREQSSEQLDFLEMLDGGVFSYIEKLIKPDKRIYERIIEKYKLNPSECVFLDDRLDNIEAAISCGLNGIQVVDHEEAHKKLFEMIG